MQKGKGGYSQKGASWPQQFYTPPQQGDDRLPLAASRLMQIKERLGDDAAKAYQALQIALSRQKERHGSQVNFEKMFYDCLNAVFPEAWDVQARQIGGQNQWEVTVDGGPPMYCSVRLEVLSDNAEFMKNVKSKARIVKDTFLENDGWWKRMLQPEYGFLSMDKLTEFEQECSARSDANGGGEMGRGDRKGNSHQWVEMGTVCQICNRSKSDDQLNGIHMCVVCATFQCPDCRYSWTSHHGRLKPDGATLMGQQCMRCRGAGAAQQWHVVRQQQGEYRDREQRDGREGTKGMHQNELCDACREFGNCTGVFYDPFILTTALSLVTDQEVQWKSFSPTIPELLIADLGPHFSEVQVCLQPHVYVPSDDRMGGCGGDYDRTMGGTFPGRKGGGDGYNSYEQGPVGGGYGDYDQRRAKGQSKGKGKGNKGKGYQDEYLGYVAPPLRTAERPSGGVKNEAGFSRFLNQAAGGGVCGGSPGPQAPANFGDDYHLSGPQPAHPSMTRGGSPGMSKGKRDFLEDGRQGKGMPHPGDEAGGGPMAHRGTPGMPRGPSPTRMPDTMSAAEAPGPGVNFMPKSNKFNKIGAAPDAGGSSSAPARAEVGKTSTTPKLDALPPLRRAQFLQVVLRRVKMAGGVESEKFDLAEEFLTTCNGDYDKAYQFVKALGEDVQLQ